MIRFALTATITAILGSSTLAPDIRDVRVEYYSNGAIKSVRTYADGKEEGIHRGWWPNGKAKFSYEYHRGYAEGVQREWYKDGQPYTEFNYRKGHEEGRQRMWTSYGKLRANYVIRDGRRYGSPGSMGCRDDDSTVVSK